MSAIPIRLRGETLPMTTELLDRYNVQGPRYTSYPTAPEWNDSVGRQEYEEACARADARRGPVSLYAHLPFCDEQCWFCGCFMKIVPKPQREGEERGEIEPYLADLHREIDRLAKQLDRTRKIAQVHWGGGTPTYLTPRQADALAQHLFEAFPPAPDAEVSVEVDPRVTTPEHL
jgi:oxygen-independent coproporphyrinogen III oxidase